MPMKGIKYLIFLLTGFFFCLLACKKTTNDAPATSYTTHLNVVNASADTINFYLNGTRLNSNSNLYPQVLSGYMNVAAFAQNYQVKKAFNAATNTVQQLFNIPLNLDTAHYYSLFIAGETQSQAFVIPDSLQTDTSQTTCLVRFVNAASDGSQYDMVVGNSSKFSQAFGKASQFAVVDTTSKAVLQLYKSGAAAPIITSTVPVALSAGKSYTFYTTGKLNGTGYSALAVGIMENN